MESPNPYINMNHQHGNHYLIPNLDDGRQAVFYNNTHLFTGVPQHSSQVYYPNMVSMPMQAAHAPIVRPPNEAVRMPNPMNPQIPYSNYSGYSFTPMPQHPVYMQPAYNYSNTAGANNTSVPTHSVYQNIPKTSMPTEEPTPKPNVVARPKKRLAIVDPNSKEEVIIPEPMPPSSNSNSMNTNVGNNQKTDTNKSTISADTETHDVRKQFQQKVAETLKPATQPTEPVTKSTGNDIDKTKDDQSTIGSTTVVTDAVSSSSNDTTTNNNKDSLPQDVSKISSDEPITIISQAPEETIVNNTTDSQNVPSVADDKSTVIIQSEIPEVTPIINKADIEQKISVTSSVESNSSSTNNPNRITPRASYTIQELIRKRHDPMSQIRPSALRHIEGVTSRVSVTLVQPDLSNRAENAYKPQNPNTIDEDEKFVRQVTGIMNKLTPDNYDKLVKELDSLEITNENRLDEMITIIFGKAVNEPSFCSLYATMCKQFQRKQVTVPDSTGKVTTYFFRQKLLTRAQKEFENDYRQEIQYEKRKQEVDKIADEKEKKEKAENLEEELGKAKRKKLGNIFFIGELFKFQMLIENIMYQCLEYLLGERSDEERLECLCRLLTTIGEELESKVNANNRKNWEKYFADMQSIIDERNVSARIRFMIQDVFDLRKANWVSRRAEVKPVKIEVIHEKARIQREQNEAQNERDRQRRDQNRSGNPSHYGESRGSRGSGIKQQSSRNDDDREPHFNVASLRLIQNNDKKNQGQAPLTFAPQCAWNKGSNTSKKTADDLPNSAQSTRFSNTPNHSSKSKQQSTSHTTATNYSGSNYSSKEYSRPNNKRTDDNSSLSTQRTTSQDDETNVSRQVSRLESTESNSSDKQPITKANDSAETYDEEAVQKRVKSLIEEYVENYSDSSERPIKEALEDLSDFKSSNIELQAIIVRDLFLDVVEGKTRARRAVGHLVAGAYQEKVLSEEPILKGFSLVVVAIPDFEVDIPLVWRYIAEIVGTFISVTAITTILFKEIMKNIPSTKIVQFFHDSIQSAIEFKSDKHFAHVWQLSGLTLADLFTAEVLSSFNTAQYSWLTNEEPYADESLVALFKSTVDNKSEKIHAYIENNMNKNSKFYIRNIVLSFIESCSVNSNETRKINEEIDVISRKVVQKIIDGKLERQVQAIYAIQNFVHSLQHPSKMAGLLFDLFYDWDMVEEEAFRSWRDEHDQSENEGHAVVVISTKDFFEWLDQESDGEEDKTDEGAGKDSK